MGNKCVSPKKLFVTKSSFMAHWYICYIHTSPHKAWCQVLIKHLGKDVQCLWVGYKAKDIKSHAQTHGLAYPTYNNYMWLFQLTLCRTADFSQDEMVCPKISVAKEKGKPDLTFLHWVWFNPDEEDPRGPKHPFHCPHPYTEEWKYCERYELRNTAAMILHKAMIGEQNHSMRSTSRSNSRFRPKEWT